MSTRTLAAGGEYAPEVVEELSRMVAANLGLWGLPPRTEIALLNLSENATFLLRDGDAARIVRVHRVGYSSPEEIRSELAWIAALREQRVIDTAQPLPGKDRQLVQWLQSSSERPARHAVAFEYLPGKEPQPGADMPSWFGRLGTLTARMHEHARSWPIPPGFLRKRWDLHTTVGVNAHWGPWRAAAGLDAAGADIVERALAQVRDRLQRFGQGPARFGLVHADLRLANLLVDGASLRIIDFDDCGFSWFLYDFAAAVSFMEHEAIVGDLWAAWLDGYRAIAALTTEEIAQMPSFIVLRRIQLMAWLASHAELEFARQRGAGFTAQTVRLAEQFMAGRLLQPRAPAAGAA